MSREPRAKSQELWLHCVACHRTVHLAGDAADRAIAAYGVKSGEEIDIDGCHLPLPDGTKCAPTDARPDTRELIAELQGTVCRCGGTKQAGNTFCRGCFYSLPKPLRGALYRRVGQGYEQAYQAAAAALSQREGR